MSLLQSDLQTTGNGVASTDQLGGSSSPQQNPYAENKAQGMSAKDKQKMMEYVKKLYDSCISPRQVFEQQWYINMCFYFGKHYYQWVPSAGGNFTRLYEPPAPPHRVRMTVNKCRRIVRTEMTKVTRQQPQGYVVPNTTDESDRMAAKAGEQISEYLFDQLRYNKILRSAAHWATLCGTSFIKTYWDAQTLDASGVPGKICIKPVTAFHIYVPDIQEEDIEDQSFVCHDTLLNREAVLQAFGVDIPENSIVRGGAIEQRFFSALGIKTGPNKNKVQVHEMWIKPCKMFQTGGLVTWAGEELLYVVDSWPYPKKDFPFAKIDHIPTGRFYGDSILVDLIPIQKEVNRKHSQIIESANLMAKPQWKAQQGSIDPGKMSSQPGLVILYKAGFQPPEQQQPVSMPGYVPQELQELEREMDDLAATGEITKGDVPPGVTAASAISYLQEENDSRFAPTTSSIEEATEKVGQFMLSFVDEYWDAQRQVKVVGDNMLMEAQMFSKADVAGNTDYRVVGGSAAPRSQAAKQALLIELRKMGSIGDYEMLKSMDMNQLDKLYEDMQIDMNQVQRENMKMSAGQQVLLNIYDNDDLHIQGHGNYMKSEEYENLPDPIKQIHQMHYQGHKQKQQAQAMQAQQVQMMQQGAVSQRPVGSPNGQNQLQPQGATS